MKKMLNILFKISTDDRTCDLGNLKGSLFRLQQLFCENSYTDTIKPCLMGSFTERQLNQTIPSKHQSGIFRRYALNSQLFKIERFGSPLDGLS